MSRTMVYVVAIPLGEDEDPRSIAVSITAAVDAAADVIGNIRLGEASWEMSTLGVKAALLDVTSKARNPL